jgi:hypothetical protein
MADQLGSIDGMNYGQITLLEKLAVIIKYLILIVYKQLKDNSNTNMLGYSKTIHSTNPKHYRSKYLC